MAKMTAMEAACQVMESEGVEFAFGVPGAAILPLYKALEKSRIKHLTMRHEEGATHAAEGISRATGKVGVAIGTSGPAGTNMVTGLYTAMADSIPLVTITGQVVRSQLHREGFQAVDIVSIVKPVTKKAYLVMEPAQVPYVFREAFRSAREGRPGPVHIDLPLDVQKAIIEYDPEADQPLQVFKPSPSLKAVEKAVEMILAAESPLILAGGGIITAEVSGLLVQLAEHLQVPVSPTLMGWGSIPADHPLYAGRVGIQTNNRAGNQVFLESDLVVALTARGAERHTGALDVYTKGRKFIQVDIDPTQIGKILQPDLGIVSDIGEALKALITAARAKTPARKAGAWVARVQEHQRTLTRRTDFDDVPIKAPRVFGEINEYFGKDTVFVTAIGLYQIESGQFQQVYKPRHYLCCGQAGPLGWEIPACIGVKKALPDKQVVGVVGDYSFQFLMEEVAVAAQYQVPYVLIMLNNTNLGLIRQAEKIGYDMRFAIDLGFGENAQGVDFVKAMQAMGGDGCAVTRPEELRSAFAWAVEKSASIKAPVLVEVRIEKDNLVAMGPSLDKIKESHPLPEVLVASTVR